MALKNATMYLTCGFQSIACSRQRIFLSRVPRVFTVSKLKQNLLWKKTIELKQKENNYIMLYLIFFQSFCSFLRFRLIQTWTGQRTDLWFVDRSGKILNVCLFHVTNHSIACPSQIISLYFLKVCIYVAASGLGCVLWDLLLQRSDSHGGTWA